MIQAVIFDFDMTLANTLKQKIFLMRKFCRQDNRSIIPLLWKLPKFFGMSMKEMVAKYSDYSMPEAVKVYKKAFRETEHMISFKGKETIKELQKQKYKIGIVSNELKEDIQRVLKTNRVQIKNILSTTKLKKSKPDPLALRIMMRRLKVKPSETIYVGDHPRDIMMGKRAGVITIGVANILHRRRALAKYKPDYIITRLDQIMKILNQIE